jgi:AbrB family looped-hinge helix DNA binding protein
MTHKLGPKGQVVVPKELRDRYGLKPGDAVVFDDADGAITIRRAGSKAEIVDSLRGMLAGPGPSLTDDLIAERRREREREDRKYGFSQ